MVAYMNFEKEQFPKVLLEIAQKFNKINGTCYLVGGSVLDLIDNNAVTDWDVEIHNVDSEQLTNILYKYGEPNEIGLSFGIIKLRIDDVVYDFSMPRKESKSGIGHKNFKIELPLDITPKQAAYRRDLTINTLMVNLNTLVLINEYNGLEHYRRGKIQHVSDAFAEDPLRVLRIMQLLPRKAKYVSSHTIELCKKIKRTFKELPKERVYWEWCKLLLKSEKPSLGLEFLKDCEWLEHFPELNELINCEQNLQHHSEGSVWNHLLMVIDNGASVLHRVPSGWKLAFMFGLLLHDVGKPLTTSDDLTTYGHDKVGVDIAERFMRRISDDIDLINKVKVIVECHMRPQFLLKSGKTPAYKRLHNKIRLDVIGLVSKCDSLGRGEKNINQEHLPSKKCMEYFYKFGEKPIEKILVGKDLINMGLTPGREFGRILKRAYEIQIDEDINDKEELMRRVL